MLPFNLKKILGFSPNTLKGSPSYYKDDLVKRDVLLHSMYAELNSGAPWLEVIRNSNATFHGERVAEYTFIASLLKNFIPTSILDIGCVLSNLVIANYINEKSKIFFLNPAFETIIYEKYGYFKFPLSEWHLPLTFQLVTCLSTIEHIGFDNFRYGINEADQGWSWSRCINEVLQSVKTIYSMMEPGGAMVISCPYGLEEFVLMPPSTGVRTAQVLNIGHFEALQREFRNRFKYIILRLSEVGWVESRPDDEFKPYGSIGPGASGVIFILGEKKKDDTSIFKRSY